MSVLSPLLKIGDSSELPVSWEDTCNYCEYCVREGATILAAILRSLHGILSRQVAFRSLILLRSLIVLLMGVGFNVKVLFVRFMNDSGRREDEGISAASFSPIEIKRELKACDISFDEVTGLPSTFTSEMVVDLR